MKNLTIKEFAEASGLSKATIYRRIRTDLSRFVNYPLFKDSKQPITISEEALDFLTFSKNEKREKRYDSEYAQFNRGEIGLLFEQLSNKDSQIAELTKQLELAQANLEREQALHHETQNALKLLQAPEGVSHNSHKNEKREKAKPGFFTRIFQRDQDTEN